MRIAFPVPGLRIPRRAARHEFAAQSAGAGAKIDHVVGPLDRIRVVLHDKDCISHVAQFRERVEQPVVVSRMQADGRLIEHVQHAAQL